MKVECDDTTIGLAQRVTVHEKSQHNHMETGMRIIVHFVIIISLNNDENRCMHPCLSISQLQFTIYESKIVKFIVSSSSCNVCVYEKFIAKVFQNLHLRLMHSIPYIVMAVWKVSTILNCSFNITNTTTTTTRSILLWFSIVVVVFLFAFIW